MEKKTKEGDKSNNSNNLNLIAQMEKMEIMKKDSDEVSSTTPMTPFSDITTTSDPIEDDISEGAEMVTDPNEDLETTTVIATSISTSEAFSYFSSASIPGESSS